MNTQTAHLVSPLIAASTAHCARKYGPGGFAAQRSLKAAIAVLALLSVPFPRNWGTRVIEISTHDE
jgi:hypothetical protein